MLDLTAIKARRHNIDNGAWKPVDMLAWAVADIDALLVEVERQASEIKQLEEYRELYYSVMQRMAAAED